MTSLARLPLTAALLLLPLLLSAPARAAVHARLVPSAALGGGWASDLFLGAKLGPSLEARVAPALRLDLSLAPALKLFAGYDFTLGLYEGTQGSSLGHQAAGGARVNFSRSWSAEFAGTFDAQSLSVAQAIDEATGVEASSSEQLELMPSLRYLSEELAVEALYSIGSRRLQLESGEELGDLMQMVTLSAGTGLGPCWATLFARGVREGSSAEEFSYWGASLNGALSFRPWTRLTVRLFASGHQNFFDHGRRDLLFKAGLSPTLRLGNRVAIESSYSYALNDSNSYWLDASRHFVFLGLKAEGELWLR